MKKISFLLLPVILLVSSCDLFNNYGKKVEFGKNEVYYKGDGVTEKDAQKLGDYLTEQKYFDDENPKSVQVTHDGEDYIVHFVVDEKKVTDAGRLYWWKQQQDLSTEIFDDKSVRIALADEKLNDLEVMNPIAAVKMGKSTVYYDNSEIKKAEAKKLIDFFGELKLMGDEKEVDVFFQKKDGAPIVRLVVDPKKINAQNEPAFSYYQLLMQEQVFNSKKARMLLTATNYEDLDPLPKLTSEQRLVFDEAMRPTENQNTEPMVDTTITQSTTSGVLRLPND